MKANNYPDGYNGGKFYEMGADDLSVKIEESTINYNVLIIWANEILWKDFGLEKAINDIDGVSLIEYCPEKDRYAIFFYRGHSVDSMVKDVMIIALCLLDMNHIQKMQHNPHSRMYS